MAGSPNNSLEAQMAGQYLQVGTVDPSVTPTAGAKGTLFILASTPPKLFQKVDDGVSINWTPIAEGASSGANTALSNLVGTAINQDLVFDNLSNKRVQTPNPNVNVDSQQLEILTGETTGAGNSG